MAPKSATTPIPRLPGEPERAYVSFCAFCLLGRSRSLIEAYRQEWQRPERARKGPAPVTVAGSFKRSAERWDWQKRAAAYDLDVAAAEAEAVAAIRAEERVKWLGVLVSARRRLERAIKKLDPKTASWASVAAFVRALGSELRDEATLAEITQKIEALEQGRGSIIETPDQFGARVRAGLEQLRMQMTTPKEPRPDAPEPERPEGQT